MVRRKKKEEEEVEGFKCPNCGWIGSADEASMDIEYEKDLNDCLIKRLFFVCPKCRTKLTKGIFCGVVGEKDEGNSKKV